MKLQLLKKLERLNKDFFSIADLGKVCRLKGASLRVSLNRWVKQGYLRRLARGIYQLNTTPFTPERIANQLYFPSYLSFESALARYGALSQIPYALTFATPRKTKTISLGDREVQFRQLKRELFFGYTLKEGIYIALAEKALLDTLYLASKGRLPLGKAELNLKRLSKKRLRDFAKHFPAATQRKLKELGF